MKRSLVLAAGLVLCAVPVVGGVVPNIMQLYPGPPRPRAEVAVLALKGAVYLTGFDSARIHFHGATGLRGFELLPGRHELEAGYYSYNQRSVHTQRIAFDAKAGKEYTLVDSLKNRNSVWAAAVVERPASLDSTLERRPACWIRSIRGTLVEWNRKAKTLTIKERETGNLRVVSVRTAVPFQNIKGQAQSNGDLVPGKAISLQFADCAPDALLSVLIGE